MDVPVRKFPMLGYWIALAIIIVLANIPFVFTSYATMQAEQYGCAISSGFIAECMVDEVDRGLQLHDLAAAGLYVLITWPLGLVAFAVWLVVLLRHRGRWKKRMGVA
jgi:uncharacterized membrane protein